MGTTIVRLNDYGKTLDKIYISNNITNIGSMSFYGMANITEVEIPNSVTNIESSAFRECSNLKEIIIPESVLTIGEYAFHGCESVERLTLPFTGESRECEETTRIGYIFGGWNGNFNRTHMPSSLKHITISEGITTINNYAFQGCESVTHIYLPNSVNIIGEEVFDNCKRLEYIKMSNVEEIGNGAFSGCESLESVSLSDKLETIGRGAFADCTKLNNILIPNSLREIHSSAFGGCSALDKVSIKDIGSWCNIDFEDNTSNPTTITNKLYLNDEEIKNLVIPSEVKNIKNYVFQDCKYIETLTFSSGNKTIGDWSFSNCQKIKIVEVPSSVESIGFASFYGCNSINSIKLPFIGRSANSYNYFGYIFGAEKNNISGIYVPTSLSDVVITGNTNIIYENTFYNCRNIETITLPEGVTQIDYYAFYMCVALNKINIPSTVRKITTSFEGCEGLSEVHITNIEKWCNIDFAGRQSNPLFYAENLYLNNELLKSLTIPSSITEIKPYIFYYCKSLETITLHSNIISIGEYSFGYCNKVSSIDFPEKLETIDDWAFSNCTSLTKVDIPNGLKKLGESVFSNCNNLNYTIYDNAKYLGNEENPYLIMIKALNQSITECEIHEDTKFISYSLYCCGNIETITIPNNVIAIGSYSFYDCSNLKSIIISKSVRSIDKLAFFNTGLETVFYSGTSEDWNLIQIQENNTGLTNATIYYYSESEPNESGNFWYYDNGIVKIW